MPLHGKTILTTRAASQGGDLRGRLEALGARVVECPAIEIVPIEEFREVDRVIDALPSYRWILFTSANAVDIFMQRLKDRNLTTSTSIAAIAAIAVVGPATAESLKRWNYPAALVPDDFHAEGLLQALPDDLSGVRILFPRAEVARETLPEELRRRGAIVDVLTVYRTVRGSTVDDIPALLARESVDCIAFTSSSTVRFFMEALNGDARTLSRVAVAVIGPITRKTAESLGLPVVIEPAKSTAGDLAEAIDRHFSQQL